MCSFTFVSLGRSHFRNVKDSSLSEFLKGCVSPLDSPPPPLRCLGGVSRSKVVFRSEVYREGHAAVTHHNFKHLYSHHTQKFQAGKKNLCFKLHEDKFVSCPRVFYIQTPGLGQKGGGFSCKMADYHLLTTDNQLLWKQAEVFADADGRCYPSSQS